MLVSVIIPCYNVEQYISECLNSVFAQTHSPLEIICIDDCSTDNTLSVLQSIQTKHPEIILLHNEENKGSSYSRNRGLSIAKGEWIQFLDADDLLLPEKIEHQTNLISINSENIGFIAGACSVTLINGSTIYLFPEKDTVVGLLFSNYGNTCANLFSSKFLSLVNGWKENQKSSQEYDLMFRIIKQGGEVITDNVSKTIVRNREHGQINTVDGINNRIRFSYLRIEMANYFQEKYGIKYKKQIQLALFETFKNLSNYDLMQSIALYKQYLPPRLNINSSTNTTFVYRCLYYVVGFRIIELFKLKIQKINHFFSSKKIKTCYL